MTETRQPTISEILDAMEESCASLEAVLGSLTPNEWHLPTGCPGWDVEDIASHIIGLEDRLAGEPEPNHELPDNLAHVRDDNGKEMELAVDYRRGVPSDEILRQFSSSTKLGLELRRASNRAPDEMTEGPFGWKLPYTRILSIRLFDCFAHEQDIRRAVGQPGNLDGKAATLTADFISSALPGLMPGRVAGLADHTVVIHVDGPGRGKREVQLGSNIGQPSASLRMPFSELMALACGRSDAKTELIDITGDTTLAKRLIENMGFTP